MLIKAVSRLAIVNGTVSENAVVCIVYLSGVDVPNVLWDVNLVTVDLRIEVRNREHAFRTLIGSNGAPGYFYY